MKKHIYILIILFMSFALYANNITTQGDISYIYLETNGYSTQHYSIGLENTVFALHPIKIQLRGELSNFLGERNDDSNIIDDSYSYSFSLLIGAISENLLHSSFGLGLYAGYCHFHQVASYQGLLPVITPHDLHGIDTNLIITIPLFTSKTFNIGANLRYKYIYFVNGIYDSHSSISSHSLHGYSTGLYFNYFWN